MSNIICLDIGTTNMKLALYTSSGVVLHEAKRETPLVRPQEGWVEIDVDRLMDMVSELCLEVKNLNSGPIGAITVTGMADSEVALGNDGKPLGRAKCWMDQRAKAVFNEDYISLSSHFQQSPNPNYIPYLIRWTRKNRPEMLSKVYKWVEIVHYVTWRLAGGEGEIFIDYSHASRSLLFDSYSRKWNKELLSFYDVDEATLPTPIPAGTVVGSLDPKFKLGNGTLVVLGGHDHMCAALAASVKEHSFTLNSTGTSEGLVFPAGQDTADFPFIPLKCNLEHQAAPDRLALVCYVGQSGDTMNWANSMFSLFQNEKRSDFWDSYKKKASTLPTYVPYNRRCNPTLTGGFSNLGYNDALDCCLSVIEGLSIECADIVERVGGLLGCNTNGIRVAGGLTKIPVYLKMKACALNAPIFAYPGLDFASLGGFLICAKAIDSALDQDKLAQRCLEVKTCVTVEPDREIADIISGRKERYLRMREFMDS